MGTQKLLLPWGSHTIIEQVVAQVSAAGLSPILVVIGGDAAADTAAITQTLARFPVALVPNADRDAEMLSSVRCGLRALPADTEAVLLAVGDQPAIRAELIERLVQAHQIAKSKIVIP